MAKEKKTSFLFYYDYRQHLKLLSNEDRGKLIMALLDYGEHGTEPDLDGAALMAFSFIRAQMDRDDTKYMAKVERLRENGKKGGRPPKQKDNDANQNKANESKKTKRLSGKSEPPENGKNQQSVPYTEIMDLYHKICTNYPKLRSIDGQRRNHVAARFKAYDGMDSFRELFTNAANSSFLQGENDRGWKADFDWLIRPTNFVKVLEGKYNDKEGGQRHGTGKDQRHSNDNNDKADTKQNKELSGFHMAK